MTFLYQEGKVSTGNSFEMSSEDLSQMESGEAVVKDMEVTEMVHLTSC